MKLGFVIYGSLHTLSGGYLYDRKLVEYLRSHGDSVEIISLPWRNYAAHLMDNLRFKLPATNVIASLRAERSAAKSKRTKQSPTKQKFDILIQDELNHASLIVANRGKHPYPIVSLVHHLRCSELRPKWQNTFYQMIEKRYLRSVEGFIFNSKTTRSVVNGLVDHGKPSIVAYPPTDRFGDPISEQEITNRAQTNPLRILFLGNVIERKGLRTLLEAVKGLKSKVIVDVAGALNSEPAYFKRIQEFITANNLSSFVFLHGSLDKGPLIEKLRQAHILVVPSSYEGFGIVYLEGMCFGLPAIGTTAGAAGEIIEHGRTGYLIAQGDSKSLADHLQSLGEDRGLLTRLSLNARERYLLQPSWAETAKSIREFLYSLVQ
jgi:glycosyltransferase involved in cell wall biosynthesis